MAAGIKGQAIDGAQTQQGKPKQGLTNAEAEAAIKQARESGQVQKVDTKVNTIPRFHEDKGRYLNIVA